MRVALCTPFSRASAVGRVGRQVAGALSSHADVEIWHSPVPDPLAADVPTVAMLSGDDRVAGRLREDYDVVLFAFGDSPQHLPVLAASRRVPGVAVLHDRSLASLFHWELTSGVGLDGYLDAIERLYGPEARATVSQQVWNSPPGTIPEPERFTFVEEVLATSLGIVTHAAEAAASLRTIAPHLPVVSIPLAIPRVPGPGRLSRQDLGLPADALLVLTIGNANPNRCPELLIRAVAGARERLRKAVVVFAGAVAPPYRAALLAEARELGVADRVRFLGTVSTGQLDALLTHADVCVNLRRPALEAASASLLDALWSGLPTIVLETGSYAEVPDRCVVKLPPDVGATGVADALAGLLDPARRRRIGEAASVWVRSRHTPMAYADALLPFLEEIVGRCPLRHASERIADALAALPLSPGTPQLARVARAADELFGGAGPHVDVPLPTRAPRVASR